MIYDRNILIQNIRKLMKDNDMKQNDLAQISNTHQNRVSLFLNGKGDFTIPQLMAIASHFDVSLDNLLGIKNNNVKEGEAKYEMYSDIFRVFFSLVDSLDITVRDMTVSDIYGAGYDVFPKGYNSESDYLVQRAISFSDEIIIKVLGELQTALAEMKQLTRGQELYETWKEGVLTKYNFKIRNQSLNPSNSTEIKMNPDTQPPQIGSSFMDLSDEGLPFA